MRRAALISSLVLALAIPVLAADGVMRPRLVAKPRGVSDVFDDRWTIPSLRVSKSAVEPPYRVCLLQEMKSLADREFPFQPGERKLKWTTTFGDVVRGLREAKDDPARRGRMLAILRKGRPSVWKVVGPYLPELINDDRLYTEDWDPEDDESDDGLLLVEPFDRAASDQAPWNALDGASEIYQAATLVYADLEAVKAAENDFSTYATQVGTDYEEVWAVKDSYVRGTCDRGEPVAAVRMWCVTDLAFPYSNVKFDVRIRTRLDEDAFLCTDIYSTGEDFYWLAGQDVAIPVRASDGEFVALLYVRVYGFDIRSVPDGEGAREDTIRTLLGNFRRRAERRYAEYGGEPRTVSGRIPEWIVRGVGPAPEDRRDDD